MAIHEIDLDGAERKICRNCVDEIWMGGKPVKLKKVKYSTVYRTEESEDYEEEVEGTVYLNGGDEVSIVPLYILVGGLCLITGLFLVYWLFL